MSGWTLIPQSRIVQHSQAYSSIFMLCSQDVPLGERNHPIQTLVTNRADQPLVVRLLLVEAGRDERHPLRNIVGVGLQRNH